MKKSVTGFALLFFISSLALAATKDDFKLEGVMYESGNVQESVAIVNGQLLKIGDTYKEHQVSQIGSDFVVFKPEGGGEEIHVNLINASASAPEPSPKNEKKEATQENDKPIKKDEPPKDAAQTQGFKSGLGKVMGVAAETKVKVDLQQIFAAAAEASERDETDANGNPIRTNLTLSKLAELQLLPKSLETGKSGPYTYSIKNGPDGFEVHADPTDSNSKLRHFMVDHEGVLHDEV